MAAQGAPNAITDKTRHSARHCSASFAVHRAMYGRKFSAFFSLLAPPRTTRARHTRLAHNLPSNTSMFGAMPTSLLKQLGVGMEHLERKFTETVVKGAAGGGIVRATANANLEIMTVEVDWSSPLMQNAEKRERMLPDLMATAANDAIAKAQHARQELFMSEAGNMLKGFSAMGGFPGFGGKNPFGSGRQ